MLSFMRIIRMRISRVIMILVLTGLHFVAAVFLLITVFGNSMGRFDSGGEPTISERMLGLVLDVLLFPAGFILEFIPASVFPGLWGYIPFFLNSLFWGIGLFHLLVFVNIGMFKREQPV